MSSTDKNRKSYNIGDFEKGLMLAGYITPSTVNELEEIEVLTKYEKELSKEKGRIYFKRTVLAAEIVNQLHQEYTFGRVKFQKLVYLCEHAGKMNLQERYAKFAAGPFDSKFMHSINKEFKKQKWFDVKMVKSGPYTKPEYSQSVNVEKYKDYYNNYFGVYDQSIQDLISLFRKTKTREVELVATIFYCWLELIQNHQLFNNESLFSSFYSWADEKKKFTQDEILFSLDWMKENGVTPTI